MHMQHIKQILRDIAAVPAPQNFDSELAKLGAFSVLSAVVEGPGCCLGAMCQCKPEAARHVSCMSSHSQRDWASWYGGKVRLLPQP